MECGSITDSSSTNTHINTERVHSPIYISISSVRLSVARNMPFCFMFTFKMSAASVFSLWARLLGRRGGVWLRTQKLILHNLRSGCYDSFLIANNVTAEREKSYAGIAKAKAKNKKKTTAKKRTIYNIIREPTANKSKNRKQFLDAFVKIANGQLYKSSFPAIIYYVKKF